MTAEKPGMEHVARPNLPWREERRTECGLPDAPTRVIITVDELLDVSAHIDELAGEDMVCRYEADGRAYLHGR